MVTTYCILIIDNRTWDKIDYIEVKDNKSEYEEKQGPSYYFNKRRLGYKKTLSRDIYLLKGAKGKFTMKLYYEDDEVDTFSLNLNYATE